MTDLETPQESVVPSGEVYIRLGYKGGGKGIGGEGVWIT